MLYANYNTKTQQKPKPSEANSQKPSETKAKSQQKPTKANKSQQEPTKANKSQQKPTKAKGQKPKAKSQKPSGHANGKFWLQNAANSKENCPRLKNKNILSIYIYVYIIYIISSKNKQTNKQTNCVATMHPKSYCQPFTTSHFVETKS